MSHARVRTADGSAARLGRLDVADERWSSFVTGHPDATPFHTVGWGRAVAESYGFPLFALALLDPAGEVVAGVPVVEVRHLLGRRRWVTLPFTDHCPPLSARPALDALLRREARLELAHGGAAKLEIRADVIGGVGEQVAVRHVLDLSGGTDATFAGFHRSQVQRNIRRAEREGVTVRVGTDATDLTEVFYRLHLATRRRQGVPVQPRRFFGLVWEHVIGAGHGTVLVAEHRGVAVAAAVFLRHNGTVIYKYGASDATAWDVRPNHAVFWHAVRAACEAGDSCFDWGRTDLDNAGLRAFKSAWGAAELPLVHTTIRPSGAEPLDAGRPDHATSPAARVAAGVIRRSPPWVCSALGEGLYRFTA